MAFAISVVDGAITPCWLAPVGVRAEGVASARTLVSWPPADMRVRSDVFVCSVVFDCDCVVSTGSPEPSANRRA